jgi:dCTP deaminase
MWGFLSDTEIRERLTMDLIIHPMIHVESAVTGCRVDLHLSGTFYEILRSTVDSYDPVALRDQVEYRREIILPFGEFIVLHPGDLILASTFENVSIPRDLVGILQGRSSLGRLGVIVHATASFIDPGFSGTITLELSNLGHMPVKLYTLARVATIAFCGIHGSVKYAYGDSIPDPRAAASMRTDHYAEAKSGPSKHHLDWEYDMIRKVRRGGHSQSGKPAAA